MHIVMGATGNVGGAVAEALLQRGEKLAIVTRDPDGAQDWRDKGVEILAADIDDVQSLKAAFARGKRAFLLNPPADPSQDIEAVECRTIANILEALKGAELEKVVAASTYGAQPGAPAGDLTTLWTLEEGLRSQTIPAAINRGAYYMTNWLGLAETVKSTGTLPTMFPADFMLPMVAPADLGAAGADRLCSPVSDTGIRHIEGPRRYTPQEVAEGFGRALGREVTLDIAPRGKWEAIYRDMGFSQPAARSFTRMTELTVEATFEGLTGVERGQVTLDAFIAEALH